MIPSLSKGDRSKRALTENIEVADYNFPKSIDLLWFIVGSFHRNDRVEIIR